MSATLTTTTKPCSTCGTPVAYEPILIGSRDFGPLLHRLCPRCQAIHDRQEAEEAAERREEALLSKIRAIVPKDLRETSVHHPDFNQSLWKFVLQWSLGDSNEWLGIIGPSGQCKTRVLALKANKMIRQGMRVFWTEATRFQTYAEDRNDRDHTRRSLADQHLRECHTAAVLIFDDIGKNTWSAAMERHFFSVLDHRKNNQLPVLWSANCHPEELSNSISKLNGGPIIGRLIDRSRIVDLFPTT